MTSGQKISFSMLISMLLFALFVVEANLKLFSKLETRFYSQAKIAEKMHQLDQAGEELDSYISDLLSVLGDYAQKPEVFSYHEHNPSEKSVTARRNVTENLFRQLPALSGIRIIDVNGRNVHYSSFDESDLLKENGLTKIYKNYNDIIKDSDEIDFSLLKKFFIRFKCFILLLCSTLLYHSFSFLQCSVCTFLYHYLLTWYLVQTHCTLS